MLASKFLVLACLFIAQALPDKEAALRSYEEHDFATAFRAWQILSTQGDAEAQFALGSMYEKGEGTSVDFVQAAHWYRRAAYCGFAQAQFALGSYYASGRGVSRNLAQSYSWLTLASSKGIEAAAQKRAEIAHQMKTRQIKAADQLTEEYEPVVQAVNGVSAPIVIKHVEPDSRGAARPGCGSTVVLDLMVDSAGTPKDVQVVQSSGCDLDEKAVDAVRKWRFRPAQRDGAPVACYATVESNFRHIP